MVIALVFIIIIILLLFFWSIFTFIALIWSRGVPSVYLSKKQLKGIVDNVKVDNESRFIDLGCGDGRVLRTFEKQGLRNLIGYELNVWACTRAWVVNLFVKSKVKVKCKSFFSVNLSEYDVVFCYLLNSCLERLRPKLQGELKSGAMVISYGFEIPGWVASEIIYTNKENRRLNRIFLYRIKRG